MASFAAGGLPMALQFRNVSLSSSLLTPPRSQILGTPLSTPPLISLSSSPQTIPSIYCGRGDRKTAKGKRFNHSFGNSRPKNKNKGRGPPRPPMPPSQPRKDKYDDDVRATVPIMTVVHHDMEFLGECFDTGLVQRRIL